MEMSGKKDSNTEEYSSRMPDFVLASEILPLDEEGMEPDYGGGHIFRYKNEIGLNLATLDTKYRGNIVRTQLWIKNPVHPARKYFRNMGASYYVIPLEPEKKYTEVLREKVEYIKEVERPVVFAAEIKGENKDKTFEALSKYLHQETGWENIRIIPGKNLEEAVQRAVKAMSTEHLRSVLEK